MKKISRCPTGTLCKSSKAPGNRGNRCRRFGRRELIDLKGKIPGRKDSKQPTQTRTNDNALTITNTSRQVGIYLPNAHSLFISHFKHSHCFLLMFDDTNPLQQPVKTYTSRRVESKRYCYCYCYL
jgi:hypothetical protein